MKKSITKLGLLSGLVLAVFVSSTALALPVQATKQPSTANQASTKSQTSVSSHGQQNSNNGKLKACENRQKAINNIINRIDERTQNQFSLFVTIASRVEGFAQKSGKKINNYSTILNQFNSELNSAHLSIMALTNHSTFTCNSSSPKAMVIAFQGYLKLSISDLKNLKTAVKNLIVAVAQANGVKVNPNTSSNGGKS